MWQKEFAIERTINEKICIDRDGNPIPWYTYPAIEYLSQFDVTDKDVFEFGCGNSSLFWADRARLVTSIEDNPDWLANGRKVLTDRIWTFAGETKAKDIIMPYLKTAKIRHHCRRRKTPRRLCPHSAESFKPRRHYHSGRQRPH